MAQPQHQLQNILFEIELEIRLISEPFGDISYLSNIPSESEVYRYIYMCCEHQK